MTTQPASVRLYAEHARSCRQAADVLRKLNGLFGGNTEWTLTADDLDEIADAYEATVAKRTSASGAVWAAEHYASLRFDRENRVLPGAMGGDAA